MYILVKVLQRGKTRDGGGETKKERKSGRGERWGERAVLITNCSKESRG